MTPDETLAELGARLASMDERREDLSKHEKWLHAELVELILNIMKLRNEQPADESKSSARPVPTTQCKSCGSSIKKYAADASIFRLSFLPLRGKKTDRHVTTKIAERIGPLCEPCLERLKDLAEVEE